MTAGARAPLVTRWVVWRSNGFAERGAFHAERRTKAAALRTIPNLVRADGNHPASLNDRGGVYLYESSDGSWWLVRREGRER